MKSAIPEGFQTLKGFILTEVERQGCSVSLAYGRYYREPGNHFECIRLNKRVVFVRRVLPRRTAQAPAGFTRLKVFFAEIAGGRMSIYRHPERFDFIRVSEREIYVKEKTK